MPKYWIDLLLIVTISTGRNNNYNSNYSKNKNYSNNKNNNYSNNKNNNYNNNQYSVSSSTKICNPYSADDDNVDCTTLQSTNEFNKFFIKSKMFCYGGGSIIGIAWIAGAFM